MYVFGIYTNVKKDPDLIHTKHVMDLLDRRNIEYYFDEEVAEAMQQQRELRCNGRHIDVLLVLGGDGTMLTATRKYASKGTMLLGLNLGRVGFLMDTEFDELDHALDRILAGDYNVEKRMMLSASVLRDGKVLGRYHSYALNEAVVSERSILRIIDVEIRVNDVPVSCLSCDGVIISTPTGSTGYSLSAGGPVVLPTMDVLLITPVCAHTLQSSNIVISGNDIVTICPKIGSKGAALTLDGQSSIDIEPGDVVRIEKAFFSVKFIRFSDKDFFLLLREKLAEWTKK